MNAYAMKQTRRHFLRHSALLAAGAAVLPRRSLAADSPANKVRVAVMGLGRGMGHVASYLEVPNVEIAFVCDVDERRLAQGLAAVKKRQSAPVQGVKDFRKILDDLTVDALSIAAPNFWHAPATILACAAGKHVYVEKPGSHNPHEGEAMVAAARKHGRVVQLGTQRRSMPGTVEGIQRLREGAIGRVHYARCWYHNARGTIGRGQPAPIPAWLDYELWQGPVPDRPYKDNLVHYNWHWMWHWGGGELANNGVHFLDLVRWGLGVDHPQRVTFGAGRYHFDDDQETPDTGTATYDFGTCGASWEQSSCHPRKAEPAPLAHFYGETGSLILEGAGYRVLDLDGKESAKGTGPGGDVPHFANFIEAIRGSAKLNQEIAEGQKSALLCHLGNIAWRTGHTLRVDPKGGKIIGDADAEMLWKREYRPGWEV
jgi:predicted dehydrogenase